jgi:transposase InsO family protein
MHVPTKEGWLYLSTIKDCFTKKIVGWAMDEHMQTSLVSRALSMAISNQKPTQELLHHSDRGSQYCSHDYQTMLSMMGISCSMSRKGNCWDNAPMESFFGRLKNESLHHYEFKTKEEAKRVIFDYIEVFYNRIRIQEGLGGKSPVQFEKEWFIKNQLKHISQEAA